MKNIVIFLASLSLFYCCCKGECEFDEKLCDPSLSDAKIAELEKCDDIYPKAVINFLILLYYYYYYYYYYLLIFLCEDTWNKNLFVSILIIN